MYIVPGGTKYTVMKCTTLLQATLLALGIVVSAPATANADAKVRYDRNGQPYVVMKRGGKHARVYCRKAFYGAYQCPKTRKRARFGPYDRDFAFSQGHQIKR